METALVQEEAGRQRASTLKFESEILIENMIL
jgi:hypothetical protein